MGRAAPACVRRKISILAAGPFDSGILATGPVESATYDYASASPEIKARVQAIMRVCAEFRIPLAAAALQFPATGEAVASVVTGMRSADEVEVNAAMLEVDIPDQFWAAMHEPLARHAKRRRMKGLNGTPKDYVALRSGYRAAPPNLAPIQPPGVRRNT